MKLRAAGEGARSALSVPELRCTVLERVINLSDKEVLLPERCEGGSITYDTDMLRRVLQDLRCSVLITGNTGSGKEVIFQCIKEHALKRKACQPEHIMELNCAGFDRSEIVESELFGHIVGAYTGATKPRTGLVKTCENGILYLDEFGWMPKSVQAKLLRFMETGKYRQVGSDKIDDAKNVRIIAATNQSVEKRLLPDLVFRFNHHLHLPSLRERGADILWYLTQPGFLGDQTVYTGITLRTLMGILLRRWDGNVRELARYCQNKVMFREFETGAPDEKEYVLDDEELLVNTGRYEVLCCMAQTALARAEEWKDHPSYGRTIMQTSEVKRVLGVLSDIATWRYRSKTLCCGANASYAAGYCLPIAALKDTLFCDDELWAACCIPNWTPDSFWAGEDFDRSRVENGWTNPANCRDLGALFAYLGELVSGLREERHLVDEAKSPSAKWLETISAMPEVRALDRAVDPPGNERLEHAMAEAGLDEEKRIICRYAAQGKSTYEIAKLLQQHSITCSASTVKSRLSELEKIVELKAFIKRPKAGRKAGKINR
jgi:hypothetical protein